MCKTFRSRKCDTSQAPRKKPYNTGRHERLVLHGAIHGLRVCPFDRYNATTIVRYHHIRIGTITTFVKREVFPWF